MKPPLVTVHPDIKDDRLALEEALACESRDGLGALDHLTAELLPGAFGGAPSVDATALTEARIHETRRLGSDAADLIDAALVARLLSACDDPGREDLVRAWRPFLQSRIRGSYALSPALLRRRLVVANPALKVLFSSMRAYFRAGLFWCQRSGIPRRWLVQAKGWERLRLAGYVVSQVGGFRPLWDTHLPPLRPGQHLSEADFVRSHMEIARALTSATSILGIASSSWYFDPAVAVVSPHLGFLRRILLEGGCLVLEVPADDSMREHALRSSRRRREAHERGEYEPRVFGRVWGREALLRWAASQNGWQLEIPVQAPETEELLRAQR